MKDAAWIIAAVVALGLGMVAVHEPEASVEPSEQEQAQNSRDFAARRVCQGHAFEWQGDVLICFKELP